MSTANQRIPVLVSEKEKNQIARQAKKSGLSMGEYLRRAAAAYNTSEEELALDAMIDQMVKATDSAEAAIDDALAFVAESNARIAQMEATHNARKKI